MLQNVPAPKRFCRNCGRPINPDNRFCSECGYQQPGVRPNQPQPAPLPVPTPRRRKSKSLFIALTGAGLILLIVLAAVIIGNLPAARSDNLKLGKTEVLVTDNVKPSGGTITVDQAGSDLDGLVLDIPEGAYSERLNFKISETPVESDKFGELFNPASPLITIDNGHGMADVPMTLTIPIDKDDDEFAMAFYYNRTTGALEGIPCVEQDSDFITIVTAHFSDIVVTKVAKSILDGRIMDDEASCDYMPGMSDFAFPNYGSWLEDGGHCTGQSLAALHYYNMNANDNYNGGTLRGESLVDNGSLPDTPGFWQDDAYAYRFCSLLQNTFNWESPVTDKLNKTDEYTTFYCFAYAMALTHSPQIIVVYGLDSSGKVAGHTMIVYEVTPDHLAIADPNFPGDLMRRINVEKDEINPLYPTCLSDYYSGTDASSPGIYFTSINYFGTYALYDFSKIDALWADVLAGKDVAASLFPADASFVAVTGRDDNNAPVVSKLANPMTISPAQVALANPDAADSLKVALPTADKNARFTFYRGTDLLGIADTNLGRDTDVWFTLPLLSGDNDIGILYERLDKNNQYKYVNFYRYQIHYTDAITTPAADSDVLPGSGFFGQWKVTDLTITGITGAEDYWKEVEFEGSTSEAEVRDYLASFNDLFFSTGSGGDLRYLTVTSIGAPAFPVSEPFTDKYFFQFNASNYIGDYGVIFDGVEQNYRWSTIPAVPIDESQMQVTGYEGSGGLDDDDMYMDLTLTLVDSKHIEGTGTITINYHEYGKATISCTFNMARTDKKPDLHTEYGSD